MTQRGISRRQELAIVELLTGARHKDVAERLGISDATLRRWLATPAFRLALADARLTAFADAMAHLQDSAGAAVATLTDCLTAARPADRVKAAIAILAQAKDAGELRELADYVRRGVARLRTEETRPPELLPAPADDFRPDAGDETISENPCNGT